MKYIICFLLLILTVTAMAGDYKMLFPNDSCWGINIHYPQYDLSDLNYQWARYDIWWQELDKDHPNYDFTKAKSDIDFYLKNKKRLLVICHIGPDSKYDKNNIDAEILKAKNFATACAKEFAGKNLLWEIGNEPEGNPIYKDPKLYTKVALIQAKAIKTYDKSAKICVTSMAWVDRPFLETCLKEGILNGGYVDAISYHSYHRRDYQPETALEEDITWMRDIVKQYSPKGKYVSVIDSECGFGIMEGDPYQPRHWAGWRNFVTNETAQAYWIGRHYIETIYNQVEISVWYKDYNGETSFSLYRANKGSELRPMGYVYKNLSKIWNENPVKLKNDKYKYEISGENSDKLRHRSLLSKKFNKLYITYWNPVEAFEGKILDKREQIGENYVDTWRDIKDTDIVEITPQVTVKNIKKVKNVYAFDIMSKDYEKGYKQLDYELKEGNLIINNVKCSACPALIIIEL